ncbi:hypothetical protein [Frigidibacter sp. ROC022]|uniref:hypothetical protein n=1 Tax=Frigidibacter sp. ROC022 TaxID=2971796 RepID=UPI00215B52CF|nr:hypothetical protein [Frigidibacter sp. ROC022]MCR8724293.1 hypothetical protein [Frigidibacter sp. ROC022]
MLFKIITLFLVGMAVLAMFGKLRMPRIGSGRKRQLDATKCPKCGAYRIGKGPCACGHKG